MEIQSKSHRRQIGHLLDEHLPALRAAAATASSSSMSSGGGGGAAVGAAPPPPAAAPPAEPARRAEARADGGDPRAAIDADLAESVCTRFREIAGRGCLFGQVGRNVALLWHRHATGRRALPVVSRAAAR